MRILLYTVAAALLSLPMMAITTDDVVAAAYPSQLSDIASQHHYTEQREHAYATISVGGINYIVAAYTNGHVGAISLVNDSATPPVTTQLIRDHQTGVHPRVTAIDLDADGVPEAVVRFTLGPRGGAETWIYRIQERHLTSIGPVDSDGTSLLGSPYIVDFEGGGVMDLVDSSNIGNSRDEPVIVREHYALRNGAYVALQPLDFYELFFRSKSAPVTEQETFTIAPNALQKPYRLTIINGGFNGEAYRASSGSVSLNGIAVSATSDFSQQRRSWTLPVTLQLSNSLAVRLEGQPSSRIIVAVRHD
jgi:hypothetical protein